MLLLLREEQRLLAAFGADAFKLGVVLGNLGPYHRGAAGTAHPSDDEQFKDRLLRGTVLPSQWSADELPW